MSKATPQGRAHNVQTPGAQAKATPQGDAPADQSESKDKDVQAAVEQSLTDGTLGTDRAETGNTGNTDLVSNQNQPEPEAKPVATGGKKRLSPADYKAMRADDIDPTTITAPVLSADGWVVPAPKEAK